MGAPRSSTTSKKTSPAQDIVNKDCYPRGSSGKRSQWTQWILLGVVESSTETRKISSSGYRQWEDSRTLLYLLLASRAAGASLRGAQGCLCSPKQGPLTSTYKLPTISRKACLGTRQLPTSQQHPPVGDGSKAGKSRMVQGKRRPWAALL